MAWDASPTGGFTTAAAPWSAGFGDGGYAPGKDAANVAAQSGDPSSLLSRYRALIRARQASPALRRGEATLLTPRTGSSPTVALLREAGGERVLVVHNLTDAAVTTGPLAVNGSTAEALFVDAGVEVTPDAAGWTARLPARASGVWRVR
jgi:glycosidase